MKFQIVLFLLLPFSISLSAQLSNATLANGSNINTISTAVPFLTINPNAQSRGIGEIGVVSSNYYYESGLTQNPALLVKNEPVTGVKISYIPWLAAIFNGIHIFDFGIYHSFDSTITFAYSYNRFDLGNIASATSVNSRLGFNAYDNYHDLRVAYGISNHLSLGVGSKYIKGKLDSAGSYNSFALDFGLDHNRTLTISKNINLRYDIGVCINDLGPKISFRNPVFSTGVFIPTTLKVGTMWTLRVKYPNNIKYEIDFAYQVEKLLVPTPPIYDSLGNMVSGRDPNRSVLNALYSSFYDAPNGFREEVHEIIHMFGIENRIIVPRSIILSARTGIFLEHYTKGNRKYLTLGTGINLFGLYADIAYLVPFEARHPLENTWNINIGYRTFLTRNNYLKNEN